MGPLINLWSFDLGNIGDLRESTTSKQASFEGGLEWKAHSMHGTIPGPISHHKNVVAGKNLYLIGGTMQGRDYTQNQMYRLDLQNF